MRPEFNWIPDQPFRAETPDAANSNSPSPIESVRRKLIRPARSESRAAPHFDVRQALKQQAESWTERTSRSAEIFRKLTKPAEPVLRAEPPPQRIEPRFELRSLLVPVAEEWEASTRHGATLLRETGRIAQKSVQATGRFFAELWIFLRDAAAAAANAATILVLTVAKLTLAAGESIIAKAPALASRAPSYLLTQMTVGALQGCGLALLAARQTDSMPASALTMVLLFVPLLLLTGFGRLPGKLMLPWIASAAVALAALGAYQYWRATGGIAMTTIAMAAIFLFIGQVLMTAWARDGKTLASYSALHDSAWSLAMQLVVCALAAAIAAVGAIALGNLLRQNFPGAHLFIPLPIPVAMAVSFASWSLPPHLLRRPVQALLTFLTLALPVVALFAAAVAIAAPLLHWQLPLLLDLVLAATLLLSINASYGAGNDRARWRQILEALASVALTPLVVLGALALGVRVAQLGWTAPRIFAAAFLGALGAYAAGYLAAALVSLGGGRWMQRMERANLAIALAVLALIAALASPLADPLRLAVESQTERLQSGQVDLKAFDFSYLRQDGRFGHEALMAMTALKSAPDISRDAYLALAAQPITARPTPTQIGANIAVRSGQGRLPASLLARDWSKVGVPGVPPCLTTAALRCEAYFTDLDGDGRDEIVLVYGTAAHWWAGVMKEGQDGWYPAGTLASPCGKGLDALRAGRFTPVAPLPGWQDLLVGGERLEMTLSGPAKSAGCSP